MWEEALEEFIKDYKNDKDVAAILLVGSYAVKNNNKYSDIDVYIILNDNVKYRERGNLLVKGYLIEYFINPIHKIIEYMKEDKRGHGGPMANMILNGKVLLDKNKIIPNLKRKAKYYVNKKYKKDIMKYYGCWCAYDEYLAAPYHNELQYFICLKYLVEAYLANNGYCVLPENKIERFFKDKVYREKYNIGEFPNNKFNKLVINCFDKICPNNLKKLYEFVIKDGDFDINNFKFRSKI